MKRKNHHNSTEETDNQPELESETSFNGDTDICQQLMSRYSTSTAPQHRHLLATAAAIRSIITEASLPLTPAAYFAAAIDNLSYYKNLDSTAVSSLLSFVSIVVGLITGKRIKEEKAREAVGVLVEAVEIEGLGVSSVRCVVKCLGVLVLEFCDLEDWGSLEKGFGTVLRFSIDKRPKVRRCAQVCLEKLFKSFKSPTIVKEASKVVVSLVGDYMPLAHKLSNFRIKDESKDDTLSKPQNLEVLHVLNLLKLCVPYLSVKSSSKILSEVLKLLSCHFSALTRHIFKIIEEFLTTSKGKVIIPESENVINSLVLYLSSGKKKPTDSMLAAAALLAKALDRIRNGGSSSWMQSFPKICSVMAGILKYETSIAAQTCSMLKELINRLIDEKLPLNDENLSLEDTQKDIVEIEVIKATCYVFESILACCEGIPNEHLLEVIALLFQKLGEKSYAFMKNVVTKLTDLMNHANKDTVGTNHLQNCIGSAVAAIGPEKMLLLAPICINEDDFTCSNVWLIPILKTHVIGASLAFYMDNIVPLAKIIEEASGKVKNSVTSQDLQAYSHGLWKLLPAFCQYPVDCHKKFGSLAKLMIGFLKDDSFMHEDIAVALQVLVTQNKSLLAADDSVKSLDLGSRIPSSCSKKTANKNMKALAASSAELLQALIDLFVDSSEDNRYLKDSIGCMASISDPSITKKIFISHLRKFHLVNDEGKFVKSHTDDNDDGSLHTAERSIMLELASSIMMGAKEDLVCLIFDFVVYIFQEADGTNHSEAYQTLSRILEEHSWFCGVRLVELIDILISLKPPVDVASLRNRFTCFQMLMFHILQMSNEEESTKAFLILNETIVTLKDGKEEARKVAYDALLSISASLRDASDEAYQKLISMVMGYLSGSSPQIKSGAVSALSLIIYNDISICLKMPDLVPSLLALLQSKAVEVIKAVLGFVKVLVSTLQSQDLQNILPEILNAILPWSSISRNHFRSKVTIVLEILIRKCGSASVESMALEKYKNFIKNVAQNRHHKPTDKNVGESSVKAGVEDSSTKRPNKRKCRELSSVPDEKGSTQNIKRQKNQGNKQFSSRHPHMRSGGKFEGTINGRQFKPKNSMQMHLKDTGRKRTFEKDLTSSAKKKIGHTKNKISRKGAVSPHATSKSLRSKKIWKKERHAG